VLLRSFQRYKRTGNKIEERMTREGGGEREKWRRQSNRGKHTKDGEVREVVIISLTLLLSPSLCYDCLPPTTSRVKQR
jgi:hypothetical protein